jgi:hypothetical protein
MNVSGFARQSWFLLLLACGGTGLLSVALGPDNYWDIRFYHLYAPWAYLHDRYLYDVAPAQVQGFLNPIADFLLYGLISSPLNDTPRVVAFIMGAVHGLNAAFMLAIVWHVIRPPGTTERAALQAVAFLIGASGGGFVSLTGTSSNDLNSALFVVGALLGVLKAATPPNRRAAASAFAAAGLAAGLGIALKNTSAIFAPGLGVVVLLAAWRQRSLGGLVLFGAAATAGFFAVAAHHMLTLWRDFGNPVFPYMNQIFKSPYFEPEAIRDARFVTTNLWELIRFPFAWTTADTYIVIEPLFRDWRAAMAYVAMVAGTLAFARHWLHRRHRPAKEAGPTRGLALVFIFVAISYVTWAIGFGYYRYVVPLEMLTGVVIVGALVWLVEGRVPRVVIATALLTLAAATTVYPDWGRRPYDNRYVDVRVPRLPADSIVLVASKAPVSYFIPFAQLDAQYVGIENHYLFLSQHNKLVAEAERVMRIPGRPKFVLDDGVTGADKLNDLLAHFGLRLSGAPCLPIETNLTGNKLSLCEAVER